MSDCLVPSEVYEVWFSGLNNHRIGKVWGDDIESTKLRRGICRPPVIQTVAADRSTVRQGSKVGDCRAGLFTRGYRYHRHDQPSSLSCEIQLIGMVLLKLLKSKGVAEDYSSSWR